MCKEIRSTQYDIIIILSKQINIVEDPTDEEGRDEMNYVQEEVRGKNCLNSLHLWNLDISWIWGWTNRNKIKFKQITAISRPRHKNQFLEFFKFTAKMASGDSARKRKYLDLQKKGMDFEIFDWQVFL